MGSHQTGISAGRQTTPIEDVARNITHRRIWTISLTRRASAHKLSSYGIWVAYDVRQSGIGSPEEIGETDSTARKKLQCLLLRSHLLRRQILIHRFTQFPRMSAMLRPLPVRGIRPQLSTGPKLKRGIP